MYLDWCFDVLINRCILINLMNTIIYICAAHFLKLIVKEIKKIKKYNLKKHNNILRKYSTFAFSILQNSITIEEFNENIKHAYNIFNLKYKCAQSLNSFEFLKKKIIEKDFFSDFQIREVNSFLNEERKGKRKVNFLLKTENYKCHSLRKKSLFAIYYNMLIKKHKKNIYIKTIKSKKNISKANFFYCPKIFEIFIKYIHIMPLWTGVMIAQWQKYTKFNETSGILTHLTNNPVENWFGQLKNSLFPLRPVMPSEYANIVFSTIESEFEQHKNSFNKIKLKNYNSFDRESQEVWKKKEKSFPLRKKGFYTKFINENNFDTNLNCIY